MLDLERIKLEIASAIPAAVHAKLRMAIQAQIADGTLRPGEQLPSERQIQEALGLNRGTIRKAINALIQASLLHTVPSTGTFVLDRSEQSASLGLIGLVMAGLDFPFYYPRFVNTFSAVLRQSNYSLVMSHYDEKPALLTQVVEDLIAQGVLALAITPSRSANTSALIARVQQHQIPLLFIGRRSDQLLVDSISTDNQMIGYQATRHLLDLGHKRIAHIGYPNVEWSTAQDRVEGYLRAMREAGLEPEIYEPDTLQPSVMSDEVLGQDLLNPAYHIACDVWHPDNPDYPTAVFCFNDNIALGTFKAIREQGLRVPDDVSIISVDNFPTVNQLEVPLTTFAQPGEQMGMQAASIILRRLTGDVTPPQRYLVLANLIKRASTCLPGK